MALDYDGLKKLREGGIDMAARRPGNPDDEATPGAEAGGEDAMTILDRIEADLATLRKMYGASA